MKHPVHEKHDQIAMRPFSLQADLRRVRQVSYLLVLVLLVWCQAFAPLLHVHVSAQPDKVIGIHLPSASHVTKGEASSALAVACHGNDDSSVVTAPPEHRRDERLGTVRVALTLSSVAPVISKRLPANAGRFNNGVVFSHASALRLRPPAHAPPQYS